MSKFDSGKPLFSLIEPKFALELAKVLTMGAEKYGPEDWKTTDNAHRRYLDALHRHLNAFERGEMNDHESGQSHLAHVAANAMFLHWIYSHEGEDNVKTVRSEGTNAMVDPTSCGRSCSSGTANDEKESRDQGKSERFIVVFDLS